MLAYVWDGIRKENYKKSYFFYINDLLGFNFNFASKKSKGLQNFLNRLGKHKRKKSGSICVV